MSPPPTEPFAVLGLPRDAAEAEVKKAYRNLALLNHPDKAGPTGLEKMKQINVAYELIIDRELCKPQRATPTSPAPKPKPLPTPKQESGCDSDGDSDSDDTDDPNPDWKPDRHRWSEPPQIHRKLTDFIMNDSGIDLRTKHRSPRSSTYHDADRLHYHLSRLHGLNETKTAKVC